MGRGSSHIPQVELNLCLFTTNVLLWDALRLKEPGFQETLKCSLLLAPGEALRPGLQEGADGTHSLRCSDPLLYPEK